MTVRRWVWRAHVDVVGEPRHGRGRVGTHARDLVRQSAQPLLQLLLGKGRPLAAVERQGQEVTPGRVRQPLQVALILRPPPDHFAALSEGSVLPVVPAGLVPRKRSVGAGPLGRAVVGGAGVRVHGVEHAAPDVDVLHVACRSRSFQTVARPAAREGKDARGTCQQHGVSEAVCSAPGGGHSPHALAGLRHDAVEPPAICTTHAHADERKGERTEGE